MPHSFLLTESHGLARNGEPVAVTASFYPEELAAHSARALLDDQGQPVPFQITDWSEAPSTGRKTRPSRHCCVHFLADLPPYGRRTYRLEVREKEAPSDPATDLEVVGNGLALGVQNQRLAVSLDPTTGQLFSFTHRETGLTLDSPRTENWDPDSFDPNRGWPQPFDWHEQPKVTFEEGKILFQLYRVGTLREYPEITLHLTYRLYAGAPYLWVNTIIEINEDVPLLCLRSEEFVFKDAHFSHLVWQDSDGAVASRPLEELSPINRHGDLVKVCPETPWLGFAHPEKGYAVAALKLRYAHFNRFGRAVRLRDHSSYFVKAEPINGLYWTRPFIYWPQHTKRDQLLLATAGSVYMEETAYCLAAAPESDGAEALYAQFTDLHARLKHPVYAEVEDELTEGIREKRET